METTLYKKNLKEKILIWSIRIIQSYSNVEIEIKTGEYYGSKVLHFKSVKPKNVGKANETTLLQQAESMVKSLILGQRKYGYKSIEDLKLSEEEEMELGLGSEESFVQILINKLPKDATDLDNMLKPMLAAQYYKDKKDWVDPDGVIWKDRKYFYLKNPYVIKEKNSISAKFPIFGQPKINGVRCKVYLENDEVRMKSKEGEEYFVEHIINWFKERTHLFIDINEKAVVFDGELYIHNELLQNIRSAVVKPNLSTPSITYEVYDLAIPDHSNRIRIAMMKKLLEESYNLEKGIPRESCPVRYVKTYNLINDTHVQVTTDKFIAKGYEGIILRKPDATYQFGKRTVNMLKLKRLIDEEYQIIGIASQENDEDLGLYICTTNKGIEFKVTPTEDEDYKRMMIMMPHLFLNKMLTCSFYEYTDKGIPFHIVHNIVRDYENNTTNKVF